MKAIITGANRGIGLSIVKKFAKEGWDVLALSRTVDEDTKEIFHQIADDNGVMIETYQVDLTDETTIKEFVKYIIFRLCGMEVHSLKRFLIVSSFLPLFFYLLKIIHKIHFPFELPI